MRVLIACEESGAVRDAFAEIGHDAWSCDLLPSRSPGNHIQGDARKAIDLGWDMLIAHPPCDYLTVSGNKWFKLDAKAKPGTLVGRERERAQQEAVAFVRFLWSAPIKRVCIENPIGRLSTLWMKPTQTIQPWMFGHGEVKATCLWLRGLPNLHATDCVDGREARVFKMPPSETRKRDRSATYADRNFKPGVTRS